MQILKKYKYHIGYYNIDNISIYSDCGSSDQEPVVLIKVHGEHVWRGLHRLMSQTFACNKTGDTRIIFGQL